MKKERDFCAMRRRSLPRNRLEDEAIRRHRDQYPLRLTCRCPNGLPAVSTTERGAPSARAQDNARLLDKIRQRHTESDGVMGAPRMHRGTGLRRRDGQPQSHRAANDGRRLFGVPQKRRWRHKRSGARPDPVRNRRNATLSRWSRTPKWVVDITFILTGEGWLYLCAVLDLFSDLIIGWSMSPVQDRHRVLKAVMMACWQRPDRTPVILHSDRGTHHQRRPPALPENHHHPVA